MSILSRYRERPTGLVKPKLHDILAMTQTSDHHFNKFVRVCVCVTTKAATVEECAADRTKCGKRKIQSQHKCCSPLVCPNANTVTDAQACNATGAAMRVQCRFCQVVFLDATLLELALA
eukprot:4655097-Amphidinium_carterae.1